MEATTQSTPPATGGVFLRSSRNTEWRELQIEPISDGSSIYLNRWRGDDGREHITGFNQAALERAVNENRVVINPDTAGLLRQLDKIRELAQLADLEDHSRMELTLQDILAEARAHLEG